MFEPKATASHSDSTIRDRIEPAASPAMSAVPPKAEVDFYAPIRASKVSRVQLRSSAKRLINPTAMVGTPMAMQSVVPASIQIAPAPIIPRETR